MTYAHILDRIRASVGDDSAYLLPTERFTASEQTDLDHVVHTLIHEGHLQARALIQSLYEAGRIDAVLRLSALGVIAAHPIVRDYLEASRLASLQEFAALKLTSERRDTYIASAHRHRGVIAFCMGHYPVALDWFVMALERERSAENLGNILAALVASGDETAARELLQQVRQQFPDHVRAALEVRLSLDADLRALR